MGAGIRLSVRVLSHLIQYTGDYFYYSGIGTSMKYSGLISEFTKLYTFELTEGFLRNVLTRNSTTE